MAGTQGTDIADQLRALSDFYVARTNWLIGRGRDDLIGAITDEYERDMRTVLAAPRRERAA